MSLFAGGLKPVKKTGSLVGMKPVGKASSLSGMKPVATEDKFVTALANAENSVRSGFDKSTNLWKSHASLEGGSDTLAYGHKLTEQEVKSGKVKIGGKLVDYKEGLTEEQAKAQLSQNIESHKKKVNVKDFDKLPDKYQKVLVNIAFNVGSVKESGWPSLLDAMRKGDDKKVRKEMLTSYKDKAGKKHILTDRRDDIADALGIK